MAAVFVFAKLVFTGMIFFDKSMAAFSLRQSDERTKFPPLSAWGTGVLFSGLLVGLWVPWFAGQSSSR